jgi:succinate-acetate transporter protein
MSVAMIWAIANGWFGEVNPAKADMRQFGWACIGYLIFCVAVTVAAFEANKVFGAIMVLILVLLASLGLQLLGCEPKDTLGALAGWSEFFISLLGFYASCAIFLNTFFGRPVLPLGKPMGWVKKGT